MRELKSLKVSLKILPRLQLSPIITGILCGGEGRNRPDFPAVAPLICLISLGIQAKSVLSDRIVFNPFGVRFGVRFPRSADTVTYEECELSALNSPAHPEEFCGRRHVQVCP